MKPGEYIVVWQKGDPQLFATFDGKQWTIHGERPKHPDLQPFKAERVPDNLFSH